MVCRSTLFKSREIKGKKWYSTVLTLAFSRRRGIGELHFWESLHAPGPGAAPGDWGGPYEGPADGLPG